MRIEWTDPQGQRWSSEVPDLPEMLREARRLERGGCKWIRTYAGVPELKGQTTGRSRTLNGEGR